MVQIVCCSRDNLNGHGQLKNLRSTRERGVSSALPAPCLPTRLHILFAASHLLPCNMRAPSVHQAIKELETCFRFHLYQSVKSKGLPP